MKSIYDRNYQRVGILDNYSEDGIHFYDDQLKTTIDSGMYTLEFKVPKTSNLVGVLSIGYYIETYTRHRKQLLMTITNIVETRYEKIIFAEDCSIHLLNGLVPPMVTPNAPQTINYYLTNVLDATGWSVKTNESTERKRLEYTSNQRLLERLRDLALKFGVELAFSVDFSAGNPPKMYVSFLKNRVEGERSFRISSDDLLNGVERTLNTYNVLTAIEVLGRAVSEGSEGSVNPSDPNRRSTSSPTAPVPSTDTIVEKAIQWAESIASKRLRYQWGGNGNPSYDCSGFVVAAFRAAGVKIPGRPTTQTIWAQQGPFKRVSRNDLRRGDLILYDTGYTYPGDANHIGIYLGSSLDGMNSVIHAGDPVGIKQKANSMKIIGYVRTQY